MINPVHYLWLQRENRITLKLLAFHVVTVDPTAPGGFYRQATILQTFDTRLMDHAWVWANDRLHSRNRDAPFFHLHETSRDDVFAEYKASRWWDAEEMEGAPVHRHANAYDFCIAIDYDYRSRMLGDIKLQRKSHAIPTP